MLSWCTHGHCHDHRTRLKLDVMTSNKRQVARFSKTLIQQDREGTNDNPGTDAHFF